MQEKKDIFRKEYKKLPQDRVMLIDYVKDTADTLYQLIDRDDQETDKRHLAIAKTKLEECVMWAVKGLSN